jgi:hypothetical protein
MGENDVLRYKRQSVITEFVINGFNCIYPSIRMDTHKICKPTLLANECSETPKCHHKRDAIYHHCLHK